MEYDHTRYTARKYHSSQFYWQKSNAKRRQDMQSICYRIWLKRELLNWIKCGSWAITLTNLNLNIKCKRLKCRNAAVIGGYLIVIQEIDLYAFVRPERKGYSASITYRRVDKKWSLALHGSILRLNGLLIYRSPPFQRILQLLVLHMQYIIVR